MRIFPVVPLLVVLAVLFLIGMNLAYAQTDIHNKLRNPNPNFVNITTNNKYGDKATLEVKFDSITINKDHDPFNRGEWDLVAFVNNNKVVLMDRTKVSDGKTYNFNSIDSKPNVLPQDKKITIQIPKQNKLVVQIFGVEKDGGAGSLPDINSPGLVGDSYWVAKTILEQFLAINKDDGLGIVADTYNSADNFGIGTHVSHSLFNGMNADSPNDYLITYTITKK